MSDINERTEGLRNVLAEYDNGHPGVTKRGNITPAVRREVDAAGKVVDSCEALLDLVIPLEAGLGGLSNVWRNLATDSGAIAFWAVITYEEARSVAVVLRDAGYTVTAGYIMRAWRNSYTDPQEKESKDEAAEWERMLGEEG